MVVVPSIQPLKRIKKNVLNTRKLPQLAKIVRGQSFPRNRQQKRSWKNGKMIIIYDLKKLGWKPPPIALATLGLKSPVCRRSNGTKMKFKPPQMDSSLSHKNRETNQHGDMVWYVRYSQETTTPQNWGEPIFLKRHEAAGGNKTRELEQGLLNVPFWVYWTSPYSSHYRPYT